MKLASLSTQSCHNGTHHDLKLAGLVAPSSAESFDFHTITWQADGFGFDATSGEFFTASPTALVVMRALGDGLTRLQILDRLTASFEVTRSTAERDLESFLAELAHIGLTPASN